MSLDFDTSIGVYVHPNVRETVLPFLLERLPSATSQAFVTAAAASRGPHAFVLATYPPSSPPPDTAPWSTTTVDPAFPGESGMYFWSSVEEGLQAGAGDDPATSAAGAQLLATLACVARMRPDLDVLHISSLHAAIAPHIPATATTETRHMSKFVFARDALPPAQPCALAAEHTLGAVREEVFDDVLRGLTVPRSRAFLRSFPSATAVYNVADGRANAWCFTSRQGSIGTLYVRPELRGNGLGRATFRKELERNFYDGGRAYVVAEVAAENGASVKLCEALGAKKMWEVAWVGVKLQAFRSVEL
jgi:GNAT superfamily N-acetyltransferase